MLVLLAILKALAPLGAGISVVAPLLERLLGLIEGSFMTTVFFRVRVPGSYLVVLKPIRVEKVVGHPCLQLRGRNFKAMPWPHIAGSPGQSPRWRGGWPQETYHLPSQNSRMTRPDPLFLGPYGDSRRAVHYAQYLSVPQRRAAGAGGPNGPRKPNPC